MRNTENKTCYLGNISNTFVERGLQCHRQCTKTIPRVQGSDVDLIYFVFVPAWGLFIIIMHKASRFSNNTFSENKYSFYIIAELRQ